MSLTSDWLMSKQTYLLLATIIQIILNSDWLKSKQTYLLLATRNYSYLWLVISKKISLIGYYKWFLPLIGLSQDKQISYWLLQIILTSDWQRKWRPFEEQAENNKDWLAGIFQGTVQISGKLTYFELGRLISKIKII